MIPLSKVTSGKIWHKSVNQFRESVAKHQLSIISISITGCLEMKNLIYPILLLNVLASCNIASEQPFYYQEPAENLALEGKWFIKDKNKETQTIVITQKGDLYEVQFMGSGEEKDMDFKVRLFRIETLFLADIAISSKGGEDSETGHFFLKINPKSKDKLQLSEAYFKQGITNELDGLPFKKEGLQDGMITLQADNAAVNAWLRRKLKTSMKFKEAFVMERE
jgi:hypothetical protein